MGGDKKELRTPSGENYNIIIYFVFYNAQLWFITI